ncbi:hypothetical protein RSP795_20915 [Ralstonia solanacearum]|nr:hypothetical protein RSP795_20915 [Ralstonia solanacearum]
MLLKIGLWRKRLLVFFVLFMVWMSRMFIWMMICGCVVFGLKEYFLRLRVHTPRSWVGGLG